jgi:hypothetical protein
VPVSFSGSVRKLADESLLRGQVTAPSVDIQRMKATAVICTPAVDREYEVIVPSGIEFADYVRNPVVLWEHGLDPGISVPIAKCEDTSGKLALRMNGDNLEGDSYFTNKVRESEQVFDLIVERIVRATSVHVMPIPGTKKKASVNGVQAMVYPKSKMVEWSWGRIGVNPEAVAKILNKNRLAGSAICESLAKSLQLAAPQPSRNTVNVPFDWCGAKNKTFVAPASFVFRHK